MDVLQLLLVWRDSELPHLRNRLRIVVQVEMLGVSFHSEEVRNIITEKKPTLIVSLYYSSQ